MSSYLFESGIREVAQVLTVMHTPTSPALERALDAIRMIGQDSAQLGRLNVSRAASHAEDALRDLLLAQAEGAHVTCVHALVELGQVLLLALAADAEHPADAAAAGRRMERRMLVVDDSRVSAAAISRAFALKGFLVRSVATMVDAMAEMTTFLPSVLVSDVHMPDLDVGVLSRSFRALSRDSACIVVLVSGTTGAELEQRLDEVKPDGFVAKMSGTAPVVECVMKLWKERGLTSAGSKGE